MNSEKKLSLKGIIVPMVTPLIRPDEPDTEHLQNLIDHITDKQVTGIFILGTTGEVSALKTSVRRIIVETACKYANHRTIMLVGIADTPLPEALTLARAAADNGADGVVVSPPHFPISQDDLLTYVKEFAQNCTLPVCLYNKPNRPDGIFAVETLRQLLSLDNVIGIKDSSGDMEYFKEVLNLKQTRPDWSVLIGKEELLAEAVNLGADGGVTGGANLFPGLYVDLYRAAVQQESAKIQRLQKTVEVVVEHVYCPDYMAGLKYALSCKQLCRQTLAETAHTAGAEQKKRIENFLENFKYETGV